MSSPQVAGDSYHRLLDGRPESSREVRATVSDVLASWGCDGLVEDAVLGAAELASNAILHAAGEYELVLRPLSEGVRIEVIDRRPDLVPDAVAVGTSAPALASRRTGRGLQIVTVLASRWGYTTSATSKSVWIEITESVPSEPAKPVVVEGHHETTDPTAQTYRLESIPVRAAVGSGVHVEELIREIQLVSRTSTIDEVELAAFRKLLDLSAPARLLGRHAAFRAAAQERARFSVDVRLSPSALTALGELNSMLADASEWLGASVIPLPSEVVEFRAWVVEELARQASGHEPAPCPLAD